MERAARELGGDLGAREPRRARGHQAQLDLARHLEVALHALLFVVRCAGRGARWRCEMATCAASVESVRWWSSL